MDNNTFRFEYRFESVLLQEITRVVSGIGISRGSLMRSALKEAGSCFAEGWFHYRAKSDFLIRAKKEDLHRFEVVLEEDDREILRKLAFTWRVSQAEVMRIAVEYYVYVIHAVADDGKVLSYEQKVRYNVPVPAPMLVAYDIINNLEARYHMLHPPGDWEMQFG